MESAARLGLLALGTALSLCIFAALEAAAQTPQGGEFQVNTATTGAQTAPAVTMAGDGDFIAVWPSTVARAGTTIEGQRFGSSGTPQGGQFQLAPTNAFDPSVSAAADGSFVTVWQAAEIQARRYDPDGLPLGAAFQVNTYTTGAQTAPAVSLAPDGRFVVAWESAGSAGSDTGTSASVQARRYAADGTAQGGQFQVNTYTTSTQDAPSVACAPDGAFMVTWQSLGSAGTDTSSRSVQAQRYSAGGAAEGGELQVNTYTTNDQSFPSVAAASDGDFMIVWSSSGSLGTDTDQTSIQAQRYADDGTPQGGEFQVNTLTSSIQNAPSVSRDALGGFVAVWASSVGRADTNVQGQRYAFDGSAVGAEFQVNTYTTSNQATPAVAGGPAGRFVVVWDSAGSGGSDTELNSIQGQRFQVATAIPSLSPTQGVVASLLLLALGWRLYRASC